MFVYRGQNLSGFTCFPLCLNGLWSELTDRLVSMVAQQTLLLRGLWTWQVPRHHTALFGVASSAFSVALLKGVLRCCCALNSAEAAPWETVFLRHGLKVPGRLLWVTCWVNKFLPSWTTLSIWGDIKVHLPHRWLQARLWRSSVYAARSSHSGWHIKSDFVNVAPSLNGEK